MAGLFFWRKKRTDEAAPAATEPTEVELAVESAPEPEPQPEPMVVPEQVLDQELEPSPEPAPEPATEPSPEPSPEPAPAENLEAVELPKRSLRKGIRSLFARAKFDPANLEELEDILIQADFGIDASMAIVEAVKDRAKKSGATSEQELKDILAAVIAENLEREDKSLNLSDGKLPYVFLVVGVNGVGKTTTIGKLANWLGEGEWKVFIGAADTFRAAAVEQVATWADRAGATQLRGWPCHAELLGAS